MRKLMRIAGRVLAIAAVVLLAAGLWKREEIMRLWTVNSLFAEDRIVANFSNMEGAFLTRSVPRGDGPVVPLAKGEAMSLPAGAGDWIDARAVTSLLVLKDGKIRHESYHLGTEETDRRISWSVAKSYLSALFGILLEEGAIASLDDPVTTYAPLLKGSAYDGASIRNVLNMASGVTFDEDYLDYDSDINRMGREIALGGALDQFAADLKDSFAAPGSTWQYVSIDTHVIGMVIRGATGRSIPDLLSEKIITPLGLEQAPYYVTDGDGVAFVLGGLNITTRDYARFGLLIEQDGRYNGQQIVPADWIAASTHPSAPTKEGKIGYGYQWWVPIGAHDGEFLARGVYGQYIYIDQDRDVVIVSTAADRKFRDKGVNRANIEMFRQIARAL
ncbi:MULTISPECIES: serine hydrolase domain-containing protein [Rhodobacterales]|jgi:CubicO group peptidase (beta-lactamase class C family)|uniref:serine hydrolase domain-containing protein n=1 Tax=Rhodobacterales TaxID=204455 RepID=UPI00237F8E63|nr:serine hydrolase [Phaeobacter gallaeciensis]MDE4141068.1 serine hydrolase [Phaeobacter gallaeciensis]MDE4149513.1 serine hydrolase [Phaeobacter gallaeciensis]MDE4154037.1 serine hydrolase [Phaeobacter gallaeciensis]MDE4229429.1 serine hydrolase [Phaeobacter gallaeciensis]MDE4258203.1 serine hydrolase [Phaeobacter gallaeciensis]